MIRRFVLPAIFVLWTLFVSLLAMVLHFLCLGRADPGSWIARRLWYPLFVGLGRIRMEVEGAVPDRSAGPFVVAVNHQSNLDVPVLMRALPFAVRFVAKRELYWIPLFGWYLYAAGYIAIDRRDRERSIVSMRRAGETMRRRRVSIVVFPEGTRTHEGEVKPFKKGAFHLAIEAQAPILPVSIEGSWRTMHRSGMTVRPGTIRLRIHEPIPTAGLRAEDVPALLAATRDRIVSGVDSMRRDLSVTSIPHGLGGPEPDRSLPPCEPPSPSPPRS